MGKPTHVRDVPGTIAYDIHHNHGGNYAAWFAALTGLPRDHVARKLAEAEARIAAGVS